MANKKSDKTNVRKLTKIGRQSLGLTLPIGMMRELGWRERQKVVAKRVRGGVMIRDWKR